MSFRVTSLKRRSHFWSLGHVQLDLDLEGIGIEGLRPETSPKTRVVGHVLSILAESPSHVDD